MFKLTTLIAAAFAASSASAVMRPQYEPFDRAACETFVLGPNGEAHRAARLAWLLDAVPLPFEPSNAALPKFTYEEGDPFFAVYKAEGATPEEHAHLMNEAHGRMQRFLAASENLTSSPLSPLQAAALGVTTPSEASVDSLQVALATREPGRLTLETYEDGRPIGAVDLSLADVRLGYRGEPSYWIFNEVQNDYEEQRALTVANFMADRGILIFRSSSHDRPIIYTVQTREPEDHDTDRWTMVHVEIYTWRRVHPGLVEDDPFQLPPLRDSEDRAIRVTSIGLRMNRVADDEDPTP